MMGWSIDQFEGCRNETENRNENERGNETESKNELEMNGDLKMNENVEMNQIILKVTDFIEGTTITVDEHPIVNDKDYVDVITTPNELNYVVDGEHHSVTGNNTYKELLKKAITNTLWNEWFYNMNGEDKLFKEIGLSNPVVYDPEECSSSEVTNIGDYINNCKWIVSKEEYQTVKKQLLKVAKSKIEISVEGIKS